MTELLLPSQLRRRMATGELLFAVPSLVLFGLYFHVVGQLSGSEWRALVSSALVATALTTGVSLVVQTKARRVLLEFARCRSERLEIPVPVARDAFRIAMRHPFDYTVERATAWAVSFVLIALGMWLQGHHTWLFGERFALLCTFSGGGLGVAAVFAYFIGRHVMEPVRFATAHCLPDSGWRRELIRRVGLDRKLQMIMIGTGVSLVVFTLGIARQLEVRATGEAANRWNREALAVIAAELPEGERIDRVAMADLAGSVLPAPALWPHSVEFELSALDTLRADPRFDAASLNALSLAELGSAGSIREVGYDDLVTWRRLSGEHVLIARTDAALLRAPYHAQRGPLIVAALLSFAFGASVAQLLAREVKRSLRAMCEAADEIAAGNLRPRALRESEDETGELAHAFERMRVALRDTVARVAQAADRIEATSGDIHSVSGAVAQANATQAARIAEVNDLMVSISRQASDVASSAGSLGESVAESSSSVIELGAAGEELNATASVLNEKVEEVSVSIEEMVRSVRRVGESTGDLADAATDTSASMEKMAGAMEAVDETAAKTADLSVNMLETAERGRTRVRETIDGMDAIREATDAAESVIRGLGARTEQIGAILDVIDDVGDETSLLALNAAIIAAQAGEQGRAFSVVADEIKELADRVLSSTKEIASVVRAVQDEAANAVGAIEAGSEQVARGVDLSAEAGLSLEEITRAAQESGTRISEIVRAVRDQTHAASHVVQLMERVRGGVDDIRSAGGEQERANEVVFQSSLTMREVARQVRRTSEEQSHGFVQIRESVESVRDTVERMNGALREQEEACGKVSRFLVQVSDGTASNEASAERMDESMRVLREQAEVLREGVARFPDLSRSLRATQAGADRVEQ